eukprot:CAMPEP_0172519094 /NCGR_PEP_ID=MMETSP1066-20121228/291210_1 /TAXON_ID=671091 /ORGANISM="Coscinodiscus wailesii, Strain CCMP2513" /LENGTH=547 /DNA_ID=CAMNT_0013301611 /DNA_START=144 /DNA_END=1787 /DNA_ORIENTATION=+
MKTFFAFMAMAAMSQAQRRRKPEFVDIHPDSRKMCECQTDYDCKPFCRNINPYTGKGICSGHSPTRPTPKPTPFPTVTGEGCPCESHPPIPTECEVKLLIEMLDTIISGNLALNGQWLRLSFHDAGTFNQMFDEGGANGCLLNDPAMLIPGENDHLDGPVASLKTIKNNWMAHPYVCVNVSSADMIQFAGFFVTVRQRHMGIVPPGVIDAAKVAMLMTFKWGRKDEMECDNGWTDNLPGFSAGAFGSTVSRCIASGGEIKNKMMDRNGFTDKEAVALIGAHTIGQIRNTFGSGPGSLAAPWVEDGDDNAAAVLLGGAANGPIFNNRFHDFLTNDIVADTCPEFDLVMSPFTTQFPDWYRVDPIDDLDHLDTDIAIAFPSEDLSIHPHFHTFTQAFAISNNDFLDVFDAAYNKMSMLGVNVPVFLPTLPCCITEMTHKPITQITRKPITQMTRKPIRGVFDGAYNKMSMFTQEADKPITPALTKAEVLMLFKDVESNRTVALSDPKLAQSTQEVLENFKKHLTVLKTNPKREDKTAFENEQKKKKNEP